MTCSMFLVPCSTGCSTVVQAPRHAVSHIHTACACMCAKGAENHRVSSTHFIPVAQETAAIKIFVPRSYLLYTGAFNLPFFSLPSDFFAPASNLRLQCSGSVCASISPLKSSGNRCKLISLGKGRLIASSAQQFIPERALMT